MKYRVKIREALLLYEQKTGRRLSQSELAATIFPTNTKNTAQVRMSKIANGEPITEELAKRIAKELKVPYLWFVENNAH